MSEYRSLPGAAVRDPLHVGLNAQLLSTEASYRAAGISVYIQNVLRHLPEAGGGHRYTVFLGAEGCRAAPGLRARVTHWPTQSPWVRILWEQAWQPWEMAREQVDLLHAMAFVGPVFSPCPYVVTVYDLSFLRFPAAFRPWNRLYLRVFTRRSVRKARRVIAISESTRADVVRLLGVTLEKVDVIPCGVDSRFRPLPSEEVEAFRSAQGLPERFFLFVGTLEPRKNLSAVFEAMHLLRERGGLVPEPFLVVVGAPGWGYQETLARLEALGLEDRVHWVGFASPEDLPLWYNAATALVYPSLYEGFGLPVLEALACGVPVITSSRGSLPEVAGGAGLLIDPTSPEELAASMARIWRDGDLRVRLSELGLARAEGFTWAEAARRTVETYERAAGLRGG